MIAQWTCMQCTHRPRWQVRASGACFPAKNGKNLMDIFDGPPGPQCGRISPGAVISQSNYDRQVNVLLTGKQRSKEKQRQLEWTQSSTIHFYLVPRSIKPLPTGSFTHMGPTTIWCEIIALFSRTKNSITYISSAAADATVHANIKEKKEKLFGR